MAVATLLERIPAAIEAVLRRHGASEEFLASEREAMRDVRVAPTNNRRVLGVMNEYAYHGEERNAPYAESSAAIVEDAVIPSNAAEVGVKDIWGVETTHYRVAIDDGVIQRLRQLPPDQLSGFELEDHCRVLRLRCRHHHHPPRAERDEE